MATLIEDREIEALTVRDLPSVVEALGMDWHHLPIPDKHAPDEGFEVRWTYAGERLRQALRQGRAVFVHCKGGLGRSGTIAARLLVELGEAPRVATDRVRKARPFALEASAQERHAHGCRAVTDAGNVLGPASRVLGCLIGGAVGDALGYAVEFDSLAAIHARFGEAGITEPVIERGGLAVSDDTQMTLFTLDGLLAGWRTGEAPRTRSCVAAIRRVYLDWLATQGEGAPAPSTPGRWLATELALQARRAPGNTCHPPRT